MAQTSSRPTRRAFAQGVLLATVGLIAANGSHAAAANPSPIMAAATRLSHLSALDEAELTDEQRDVVTREQLELQYLITDTAPQSLADAVVLLMVAVAEIGRESAERRRQFQP